MKQATLSQASKILSVFEDTPSEQVQAVLGSGFLADLRDATNVAAISRDEFRRVCGLRPLALETIITINRSTLFNPAEFIGQGWSIWKGPADGDGLSGAEDQDERSLALNELDLSKVQLITCLKEGETRITGTERVKRLKATNHICLDAKVFQTFWENQQLIPESWKEKTNTITTYIFFDGTTLRSPYGDRSVLCLFWSDGGWRWFCRWLEGVWGIYGPSVVLASLPAEGGLVP